MNKRKQIGRILLCLIVSFVMVVTLIPRMPANLAYAAAGDEPEHAKILQQNEDGTYTIALNITGESEKKPQHVNVIVIVDRSGSMGEPTGPDQATYTASNDNGNPRYGIVNGEYVRLTRYQQFGRYYYYYGNTQYTGTRYIRTVLESRLDATQDAVNGLAEALLGYNTQTGNDSDTVEMALVSFSTNSTTDVAKTTSYATFSGEVDDLEAEGGTNWESALSRANGISFGDEDPTYVIFFSDGAPTFHTSNGGYNNYNSDYGVYGSGQEEEPNMERSYTQAADDAQRLATKVGAEKFYTIFAYGEDFGATYMTDLTEAAGAPAGNNYTAANTVALQQAFAEILQAIEMSGIGNVDIEDGTTSSVTTASGTAHLLDVAEPSTFKYYRAGGTDENGNEKYDSDANTITDPDGNVTNIGEQWTDAPAATFEDGAVKWDLGEDFLLENGVTYTVTFDCWPSQETLDHIASIKNDPTYYDSLDPAIKQYLNRDGSLATNTSATLSYDDTRTDHNEKEDDPIGYENPDPVETSAVEQLAVSKDWHNELEDEWDKPDEIVLDVTRDGNNTYTATLNDGNEWKDGVYISIGIMRTSGEGEDEEIELLTTGHNFTFAEPGAASGYKWELNVPTVRPMKINGTDTILVLVDEDHQPPAGAKTYTLPAKDGVAGGTYYVDNEMVSLTATNERRSSLNIRKVVEGEDVPEDATFPFTLNVVNSLAPEEEPENDPGHDSDWWVWISVRDMSETDDPEQAPPVTDAVVSGATHAGGGWYYGVSGQDIVLNVKDGYSIRLNNLPVDSSYTVTEGELDSGFIFEDGEIEIIDGSGTKTDTFELDKEAQKVSGEIEETNTLYQVTMTNKYELIDINVDKVWDDNSDQDGIRPETLTLTLNGLPTGTTAPTPEIEVSEDGNTWTYTWKAVPRYDSDGNEIEYTVTEGTVPTGYTCEETTAEDGGTITNVHEAIKTKVSVEKIWDDANDQDGVRPDSVSVQLMAGDEEVGDPVTLNETNQWKYTWEELDAYAEGELIEYSVTEDEDALPEGYIATVEDVTEEDADIEEDGYAWEVTNSYSPEETTASVTKAWDDADDQDGIRPDSVTLTLYADGVKTETTVTLSEENDWTDTVTGLDKYAAGEEIEYTWKEEAADVPEGYEVSYGSEDATSAPSGGTVTNTHEPEETTASVTKAWDDADDQDGIRPTSIVLTLLADGEETETTVTLNENNEWSATVTGLDKYAAGEEIEYTWVEKSVPTGYEVSYGSEDATSAPSGGTVTNTHEPEETEATVKKEWDDADNQDGVRPDSIDVTLLADGKETETTVTLSEDNEWTATITGLDKYAAGEEIEYTWEEDEDSLPEGYTLTGAEVDDEDPTIITLTNHREVELVNVTVEKVWDDNEDQDGKRPESVTVQLKADGEAVGDPVTLNEANEWTYEWENLEKYKAGEVGQEVEYTVEEVEVPTGYEADVTGNAAAASGTVGYIITNIHEPETINLTITKEWDDNDDQDGKRPDDLTVKLSDGETTVTLSESNDWSATVEGLPRYAAGEEIEYSWTEDGLSDDYELTDTATTDETDEETGKLTIITTLTNTHELELTDVSVEKTWDDADDRDEIRPDSVTVTLLANGNDVSQEGITATVVLSEDNNWKYTWTDLYVYADGKEISYTVEEDQIDGYEPETTGDAKTGYTIKNIHQAKPEPVMSDPPVKKVVKGNPSKDETFTFQMTAKTEGAPMPEGAKDGVMTMDIVGSGEKEFGEMWFYEAGTYVYEITEVDTKAENYTYDTTAYTLTVEVTEEKVGNQVKLNKTETVTGGDGQIVFTNTYTEPPVKTGDTTIVMPYIVIGISALVLLIMLLFRTRKNRA